MYALIAGGSKGIGYAIAEALAKRKYNLILVGRHDDTLQIAKQNLESSHKIKIECLQYDLSNENAAEQIAEWCKENQIPLNMLCNVAGIGGSKDYLSLPLDQVRYMVKLNALSDISLCLTLLPLLETNAPSYILNVGSMAGFAPIPIKNVYAATKSFIISFSYALRYQLRKRNISVSCLCPGPVFTKPEIEKDTLEKLGWFGKQMAVEPKTIGEVAVRRTLNKSLIIVPGFLPKLISIVLRVFPRRLLVFVYDRLGN